MTKLWERAHANGWVACITPERDPAVGFAYAARRRGEVSAQWAGRSVDLALAQNAADAMVPEHECNCSGWTEREGTS